MNITPVRNWIFFSRFYIIELVPVVFQGWIFHLDLNIYLHMYAASSDKYTS